MERRREAPERNTGATEPQQISARSTRSRSKSPSGLATFPAVARLERSRTTQGSMLSGHFAWQKLIVSFALALTSQTWQEFQGKVLPAQGKVLPGQKYSGLASQRQGKVKISSCLAR